MLLASPSRLSGPYGQGSCLLFHVLSPELGMCILSGLMDIPRGGAGLSLGGGFLGGGL